MNGDPSTRIENDAVDKLKSLFEILPVILPVQFILGGLIAYIRSMGRQKMFIMFQVIVLYGVHF